MSLYYISVNNSRILTTNIFHWLELISVIETFLKIFSLKKNIHSLFFSISENLQDNQSLKVVFWKD